MAVTIRAVAEAAGVSVTTVSFVLNNSHPHVDAIPRETRERVKAAAASLGYRRNAAAATLRTGKSLWIGTVMQALKNEGDARLWAPYELSLLSGVQKTVSENGYFVVLGCNSDGGDNGCISRLVSSGIGGLILRSPSAAAVEQARQLVSDGIPTAVVFPVNKDDLYPYSVDVDNEAAGRMAASLFAKAGRKAPMCIWDEDSVSGHADRVNGFRDAIQRDFGSSAVVCGLSPDLTEPTRVAAIRDFIHSHKPDAVMAADASNAHCASVAAADLGLDCPRDIAIIGFDCYSFRSARGQRLSAIATSWWEAGRLAAEGLSDMISKRVEWTQPTTLSPQFIPGDSTPANLASAGDLYWVLP